VGSGAVAASTRRPQRDFSCAIYFVAYRARSDWAAGIFILFSQVVVGPVLAPCKMHDTWLLSLSYIDAALMSLKMKCHDDPIKTA
jgi:hypothetical protein